MREAVGGYEGVRKVWIYFISCFLALCSVSALGLCQHLSRESGHPRSRVHAPSSMDSPGMEGPCCTKGVHVLSMLQQCL